MEHLFVPYKIALELKEKGFNEPCLGFFKEEKFHTCFSFAYNQEEAEKFYKAISAPLYQQVMDWFREKHNIHLAVDFEYLTNKYDVMFQEKTKGRWERYTRYYASVTYNEALNKGIEEALKLI